MIIKLLLKNWKLILDIAIVLAVIFLLFLWNPGQIFGKGSRLHDTANMVSEIKEIGELITAEYYGEVIASDEESMLGILDIDSIELVAIQDYIDEIKKPLFEKYIAESATVYETAESKNFLFEKGREKFIRNQLIKIKEDIVNTLFTSLSSRITDDKLHALLLYLAIYEHGTSVNQKKFVRKSENQNGKYTARVLKGILEEEYDRVVEYADGDADFDQYLSKGFTTNYRFVDFYYDYMEQTLPRKEQKVELAVIGRGSVKAGFRFEKLDEHNVVYDENTQIIYLFGFNSEILYTDINPWFIPEKGVPGFQIIMAKNASFEKMKELKMHCVDKLRYKADLAGIKQQAQENGEVAIAEFFSLLMGQDIKKVVFRGDPLKLEASQILEDSLIAVTELPLIDSLISRELVAINKEVGPVKERRQELLQVFIDEIGQYSIHWKDQQIPYNYFNRQLPIVLKDSMVTRLSEGLPDLVSFVYTNDLTELVELKSGFDNGKFSYPDEYKYWSADSLAYYSEYNQFLELLEENGNEYVVSFTQRELVDSSKKESLVLKGDTILTSLIDGSYLYHYQLVPDQFLDTLKFDLNTSMNLTQDFLLAKLPNDSIEGFLKKSQVKTGSELYIYLKKAKENFNAYDNGFKRFRRAIQVGEANNVMTEVRSTIDEWARELRPAR